VAGLLSCAFANPKGYGDYDGAYDDLGDYGHHHNIVPVKKVVEYYVSRLAFPALWAFKYMLKEI